tara:strand:- start:169 stop:1032 length:864 start_codon:yes stop_codon:yes gene_type:complete
MLISGFTFLRNGSVLGYPFIESIKSILPIVDEFVIALGKGEDDTLEQLLALQQQEPKIRIIQTTWSEVMTTLGYVYGQQKMIAQFNCLGQWAFYLEADEIVHEDDLEKIHQACLQYKDDDNVEALVFDYLHFWGNKNTYLWSPSWYRSEPRIIKQSIRTYAPDGLYWIVIDSKKVGRYPKAKKIGATMYHYGWIRTEEQASLKASKIKKYWNKTSNNDADYTQIDSYILKEFTTDHPAVMNNFLLPAKGIVATDPNYKLTLKDKINRFRLKLEAIFNLELSKRHYKK